MRILCTKTKTSTRVRRPQNLTPALRATPLLRKERAYTTDPVQSASTPLSLRRRGAGGEVPFGRGEVLLPSERRILSKLTSPKKIQDYLNSIPFNFEHGGETCLSPRRVLREQRAHCMEGALLAALALRLHGHEPLILDLTSAAHDTDHIIVPFRQYGCWGAISKTNHSVLRYREPVYRTIRELVLSYFHEYFDTQGKKTLRSYTHPINLRRFDARGWVTDEQPLWYMVEYIMDLPHKPILTRAQIQNLRIADEIEQICTRDPEWITQNKKRTIK